LLGGFVGCSEAPEESAYVPEFSKEDITATISEETRTLLGAENEVLWSEGDAISFFNKSTLNQKYVLKSGKGTTKGTFGFDSYTGTHTALTQNYSVYPWGDVTIDETNKKVTGLELAAEQTYTVGQPILNGAPMVAVSDSREMQFKNTIGLIRVNVKAQLPSKYTLNGIEFSSVENNLAGEAEISLESNELSVVGEGKSVEVTLAEAAEVKVDEAVAVYALIPATAFAAKDLTITLKLTNNFEGAAQEVVKVVPSAFTLERSKIFTFNITFKEEDVVGETEKYENALEAALVDAAMNGGEVTLTENITLDKGLTAVADMVVNLNGYTITYAGDDVLFRVNGSTVTINGSVDGSAVVTNPTTPSENGGNGYIGFVSAGGTLNIKGGDYDAQETCTIAQVKQGTLNVYGGTFKVNIEKEATWADANGQARYLLNCSDAQYRNGEAVVNVYGGTFYKFNPANNAAEGANTNFVAEGYSAVELESGVWAIAKLVSSVDDIKDALNNDSMVNMSAPIDNGSNVLTISNNDVVLNMDDNEYEGGGDGTNNYAFNVFGSNVEVNDANIVGAGFAVLDESTVTINSGSIAATPGKSGRNMFYVLGNSTVTVNEGTYTFDRTSCYFVYVEAGSTCYINGGHFEKPLANNASKDSFVNNSSQGTVIIKGGTFNVDPTRWLADGYKAVKSGRIWTVSQE
uniref:hypothetical protein n=1 Tax=Alistipes sp. TaxID=1872444 RepID=UPI004056F0A3